MKKLKLSDFDFTEILSRDELKKIVGGDFGSGSGSGSKPPAVPPKVAACQGKKAGDQCSFLYNGKDSPGYCRAYAPDYTLHCSNLL
ncbi:hypothetical protein ACFE6N_20635 [Pedobacter sp. BG31]|uniref:hypothetical protein n=1 Tax=Pedobacter sp. BG31 TaxID=3349697 RepID=UPI0035F2A613